MLIQRNIVDTNQDDDCQSDDDVLRGARQTCMKDFCEMLDALRQAPINKITKNAEVETRVKDPDSYDRNGNPIS